MSEPGGRGVEGMSIFDHPDDVPPVATWRCPHCATLQPESTRCWACQRSPMTCATCRYFRRTVTGRAGLCGLDRTRALLTGDEARPCWQPPTDLVDLAVGQPGSGRLSWVALAERATPPAPRPVQVERGTTPGRGPRLGSIPERLAQGPSARDQPTPDAGQLVEAPTVAPAPRLVFGPRLRARTRARRSPDGKAL